MQAVINRNRRSRFRRADNFYFGGRSYEADHQDQQNGIQDCSRGGTYHNKKFRDAAEARDLHISYDSRIGWSITEPTDALIEFIISQGWDDIMMNRQEGFSMRGVGGPGAKGGPAPTTGRTSSTRKIACPCCGQSVRATKKVNIICGNCFLPMMEV